MLTRFIYMTKPKRSVSKQGHLQPHCHSKARSPSRHCKIVNLLSNLLYPNHYWSFCMFFSDTRSFTYICLFLIFDRRKFGLVCALLNQCVYILFVLLLMIMMKKQVDAKGQNVSCSILRMKTTHAFSKFIYLVSIPKYKKARSNAFSLAYISLYTNYQVWDTIFPRVCKGFLCDFA